MHTGKRWKRCPSCPWQGQCSPQRWSAPATLTATFPAAAIPRATTTTPPTTEPPAEETVEEEIEEEIIETPFATSKTTYTEEVFDAVFKKDYTRYCVQILISTIGYLLITLYTVLLKVNLFTYIGIAITGYSFVKFVVILSNYKKNKHKWLEQYGNIVKRYDYYKDYILITSDSDNQADVRFEYSTIVRVIEKTNYILCMVLAPAKTILIIDKSSLDDESLVKVRATLKETCMDYIEKSPERKEQQALTKTEKTVKILNIM